MGGLLAELTAAERAFVLKQRAVQVLDAARGFASSAHYLSYMDQCGGDATLVAIWYGRCVSSVNLFSTLLSPVVGSLSDTLGRKRLHAIGRFGPGCCFLSHILCQSLFLARPDDVVRRQPALRQAPAGRRGPLQYDQHLYSGFHGR